MIDFDKRVHELYWNDDVNCATTIITTLSEKYDLPIEDQVIYGLKGLPGAAKHRALCGLVSGGLIFIGIYGTQKGMDKDRIKEVCYEYSEAFINEFKSLECYDLRPNGFNENDPPHLCESLTCEAVQFAIQFLDSIEFGS